MLAAVPRRKIRDVVADRIKDYIAAEKLAPGDRLPTELELAERFGVSRLSVREATKALEFLGIVESRTGVGLSVGRFDFARVTNHLGFHPALHQADPAQLVHARVIIETGVLPHVVQRITEDRSIVATLRQCVDQFRSARTLEQWIEHDIRFHHTLLDASGITPLVAFGDLLQVFFRRFRDSVKQAEWKKAIESHERIVDRLAQRDAAVAASELQEHIESHLRRMGAER